MDRILEDFRNYLRIERGMSPNTVASYGRDVRGMLEAFKGYLPKEIKTENLERYLSGRISSGLSKRSQARLLSSLRAFFNWCIEEGDVKENPCDRIEAPKLGKYLPAVLSVEEVDAIISSVDTRTATGLRNRAILEVLYGCGLRVSECTGLLLSHIHFDEGYVDVVGKGDKQRVIPLGEMAADAVRNYLPVRPEPAARTFEDILFLNKSGRPLSRVSIFNLVKERAMAAGIQKEISPHTFRHSFATHLIEGGADLRIVQEMLVFEAIGTTEIYTHIDSSTWQAAILEHHPRK